MQNQFYIQDWVNIKQGKIFNANKLVFEANEKDLNTFFKAIYDFLKINYPKFHKVDGLSKLGIIASEIISKNKKLPKETALVFANNASSLKTDRQFQDSTNTFASPSLFVYTLPNIVLGEISIRYKLQSENAFFIAEKFNPELLKEYTENLLDSKKSPEVLCGWLDLQDEEYDVFLCRVSKEKNIPFSEEILKKLYYPRNDRPTQGT